MGKEEGLGKILMKGYFETMKVYREVPNTIFFSYRGEVDDDQRRDCCIVEGA